ncbi:MAG: MFS transporter [bacterium]
MLKLWQKAMYGAGYIGVSSINQVILMWLMYFYVPPPGEGSSPLVPAGAFALAMGIGRAVDALADPPVGFWSDNTRSRWGRRIPFIAFGAPLLCVSFFLLWFPPSRGPSVANSLYLTAVLCLFFFAYTVVVAPYWALLPEIARSSRERVQLSAWQALMNFVALAAAVLGSSILVGRLGFRAMGAVVALFSLVHFYLPVFAVRGCGERVEVRHIGFMDSIRLTLRNPSFLTYLSANAFLWFGLNMLIAGMPYVVTVIIGRGRDFVGWALGVGFLTAALSYSLIARSAERWGKKPVLLTSIALLCAILPALSLIGRVPRSFLRHVERIFVLALSSAGGGEFAVKIGEFLVSESGQGLMAIAAMGPPLAGLLILPNAVLAEIVDRDADSTGVERSAMYFGMQGLILKATLGASTAFLSGFVFRRFGYGADNSLGIRLIGPLASASMLIGLGVFSGFRLESSPRPVR